ncbi:hypothetical protein ACK9YZ_10235 [Rhizobium sp. ZK1]|uniref:hypothetical protein n=1 Tax=Rhizobium sp. ZK1 TaxID=3389872 RepID=UPI0039F64E8C
MNLPQTKEEWIAVGLKVGWLFSRLQILGIVVGALVTIALQLLTGFWDFRENHQKLIIAQYEAVLAANARFEEQVLKYNVVFDGRPVAKIDDGFSGAAQSYIGKLQGVSRLLPATESDLDKYINALSLLNTYYSEENPPAKGSVEWMRFYGNFRVDYDRYIKAKENYLNSLASQLGDYKRYLANS